MKTRFYILMLALGLFIVSGAYAATESAGEKADASVSANKAATTKTAGLETEMEKVSYVIGTQIGQSFKQQSIDIILESLIMGIKDILTGKELALSAEESQKVMLGFRQRMMAKLAAAD